MRATLTAKRQSAIPKPIRARLGLEPGQQIDFDADWGFLRRHFRGLKAPEFEP